MFNKDILALTKANTFFRQELATHRFSQLVVMSIEPGEDIGMEVHDLDQILVFIEGEGEAVLDGETGAIGPGSLVIVPAGVEHNFTNTGTGPLKLFTIYAPAEHAAGTVHKTKADDHHHH